MPVAATSGTDRRSRSSNVSDTVEDQSRWYGFRLVAGGLAFLWSLTSCFSVASPTAQRCNCSARCWRCAKSARIENTLLLLEHPPVITLGRNARLANVLAPPEFLAQQGVELFDIDRGGDVTFHGPGQLIAYPIFDLRSFDPKVGAVEYVRRLEEVLIRTCGDFGVGTQRIKGLTGVWTYALPDKPEAKIAAIGVHISRSVTTHGFALNVSTDLDSFSLIVPCGITDKPVTSLERELTRSLSPWKKSPQRHRRNFGRVFQTQMLWLESLEDLLAQAAGRCSNAARVTVRRIRTRLRGLRKSCAICWAMAASWRKIAAHARKTRRCNRVCGCRVLKCSDRSVARCGRSLLLRLEVIYTRNRAARSHWPIHLHRSRRSRCPI